MSIGTKRSVSGDSAEGAERAGVLKVRIRC